MLEQWINQGRSAFRSQRYQEAFELLSRAIGKIEDQDGGDLLEGQILAELYLLRGTSLFALNEQEAFEDPDIFNQIADDYEQSLEMNPDYVEAYALRGRLFLNCEFTDYTEEARQDFSEVLRRESDHWETLNYMGQLFYGQEEYDKAIYYFSKVIEQEATVSAHELRALAFFQKLPPDYVAAAADFEQAKLLSPEREEFYIWRAQCFQELSLMGDAIREYDQLIERFPGESRYWLDRGTIKVEVDPAGALQDFERSIALSPNALAFNNRAFYYKMQGDYEQAIADVEMALELEPGLPVAYATLAEIYAEMEDETQFYKYLELALEHYYEDTVDARSEIAFQSYAHEERFLSLLDKYSKLQSPS